MGRRILARAGLLPPDSGAGTGATTRQGAGNGSTTDELVPLRDDIVRRLVVYPLPKNMDPERDGGRRAARALALAKQHREDDSAVYVDAARCRSRPGTFVTVAVRASTGELLTASSVRARTAGQAEEMAIALAMNLPGTRTVLSDSKSAVRNFARGVVWNGTAKLAESQGASRALEQQAKKNVVIKWFPAHAGRDLAPNTSNRNEEADAAARDLATCRAAAVRPPHLEDGEETTDEEDEVEPLSDYGGVLRWHREQRRTYPPPHRELSRAEATRFRQLQAETVLTPALARHMCPDYYESDLCSACEREPATLRHLMWGCESAVRDGGTLVPCPTDTYSPEMRECVNSTELQHQRRAIQRLEAALAKQRRKGAPRLPVPPDNGSRSDRPGTSSSPSDGRAQSLGV